MITALSDNGSRHEVAWLKAATYIENEVMSDKPSNRKSVFLVEIADAYVDQMDEEVVIVWWTTYRTQKGNYVTSHFELELGTSTLVVSDRLSWDEPKLSYLSRDDFGA